MIPCVVISEQRTGSNLLLGQIAQHPDITNFGEVFNPKQVSAVPKTLSREEYVALKADDPVRALQEHIFPPSAISNEPPVHVFKLQYQNIKSADGDRVMDLLSTVSADLHVIHLIRRNAFERYVSKLNAEKTSKYFVSKGSEQPRQPDPYPIGREEARRAMRHYLDDVQMVKARLKGKGWPHKLTVFYEDLVTQRMKTMKRIFEFLNLPPMRPEIRSQKQSIPPRFQVRNYEKLRERFSESSFADFFEAGPGY